MSCAEYTTRVAFSLVRIAVTRMSKLHRHAQQHHPTIEGVARWERQSR
jgi:hypothetical protein